MLTTCKIPLVRTRRGRLVAMSSYSSLLSLSPVDGDDDDMAVAAALSSYLSLDIDVSEEYYPLEAAAAASFHPEQQAPESLLASLQGTDDYKNGELTRSGANAGESSKQSHLEVRVLSSDGLSSHDKIDKGSSTTTGGGARSLPRSKDSKIAFKTRSEVDVLEDGYRWRKYGKKMVKNSPNPRNYYRCSSEGCHVKKRVEREGEDARFVVTTYDGVHNHPAPLPPRGCAGYSLPLGQPQGQRVEEESQSMEGRSFLDMKPHAAGGGGLASQLDKLTGAGYEIDHL